MASPNRRASPRGGKTVAKRKGLQLSESQQVRNVVEALVQGAEFEGNKSKAARRLGVSQSFLHGFLEGKKGPSWRLVIAVADYLLWPVDKVIGRKTPEQSLFRFENRTESEPLRAAQEPDGSPKILIQIVVGGLQAGPLKVLQAHVVHFGGFGPGTRGKTS